MELEKAALPTTEEEQNLIGSAVQNAEGVIKEQLDAKSGPIQYMLLPREKRDEQSDKLVRIIYSQKSTPQFKHANSHLV
jgi:D-alanyl-D-alanine carboxypeptidase